MSARVDALLWQGQPCWRVGVSESEHALISAHGAQVVSWVSGGRERLYLSPRAVWDAQTSIRGGIPVCFPQFNQRGPQPGLPKHGFARQVPWALGPVTLDADSASVSLRLTERDAPGGMWAQPFEASLTVTLAPGSLQVTLGVSNTGGGPEPLAFTGALHTYLAVDDIAQAQLHGLQGQPEWNALTGDRGPAPAALVFAGEFDRVYTAAAQPLRLVGEAGSLHIAQGGFEQSVVWNPGAALCANLPDLPPDGFRHMLCVEAACVDAPVRLSPGEVWQGWQRLVVA